VTQVQGPFEVTLTETFTGAGSHGPIPIEPTVTQLVDLTMTGGTNCYASPADSFILGTQRARLTAPLATVPLGTTEISFVLGGDPASLTAGGSNGGGGAPGESGTGDPDSPYQSGGAGGGCSEMWVNGVLHAVAPGLGGGVWNSVPGGFTGGQAPLAVGFDSFTVPDPPPGSGDDPRVVLVSGDGFGGAVGGGKVGGDGTTESWTVENAGGDPFTYDVHSAGGGGGYGGGASGSFDPFQPPVLGLDEYLFGREGRHGGVLFPTSSAPETNAVGAGDASDPVSASVGWPATFAFEAPDQIWQGEESGVFSLEMTASQLAYLQNDPDTTLRWQVFWSATQSSPPVLVEEQTTSTLDSFTFTPAVPGIYAVNPYIDSPFEFPELDYETGFEEWAEVRFGYEVGVIRLRAHDDPPPNPTWTDLSVWYWNDLSGVVEVFSLDRQSEGCEPWMDPEFVWAETEAIKPGYYWTLLVTDEEDGGPGWSVGFLRWGRSGSPLDCGEG